MLAPSLFLVLVRLQGEWLSTEVSTKEALEAAFPRAAAAAKASATLGGGSGGGGGGGGGSRGDGVDVPFGLASAVLPELDAAAWGALGKGLSRVAFGSKHLDLSAEALTDQVTRGVTMLLMATLCRERCQNTLLPCRR